MIKRYFYIFSASLFILLTSTTGVKADFNDEKLESLARQTNSPPDGINYQAVLRDDNGDILANADVIMRYTLSDTGGDVYIETHTVTTNANGMITLVIGNGTQTGGSASSYPVIDWSMPISIKVEADSGNGFVDLGTNELQSVPYANFAANGLTDAQATEIGANTAKSGITQAQSDAIEANTLKGGVTPDQATTLANTSGTNTGDQDITGIATNETAITLNTAKTGITPAQASEISANTAKAAITPEQATTLTNTSGTNTGDQDITGIATNATSIALNTAKVGITPAQATEITDNTAKADITPAEATVLANTSGTNTGDQDITGIATNATAIALNTTKTGITPAQASEITANTAKAAITPAQATTLAATSGTNTGDQDITGIATNATSIALNTAKVGITPAQATEITDNTAKVGITPAEATVLTNTSGSNTGDQDITGIVTNATAIALNTAKTGITTAQANEITANTAKISGSFSNTANVIFAGDADDDFLFGSTQLADLSGTGDDKRIFFDKSSGAVRLGGAQATQWDSPGPYSFAAGSNNNASGVFSFAGGGFDNVASGSVSTIGGGGNNVSSGQYSTVGGGTYNSSSFKFATIGGGRRNTSSSWSSTVGGGQDNTASVNYSTVGGGYDNTASNLSATISGGSTNQASAYFSTVSGGQGNIASGKNSSVAGGKKVLAQAFGELAGGVYSANASSPNAFSFVATDRIFTLGNGTADAARSNAMVILKNGNTDINGNLVANSLGVDGAFALPTTDGSAGQVLQTDGAGAVSWQTASGGSSYAGAGTFSFAAGADNSADANYSSISGGRQNDIGAGKGGGKSAAIGGGKGNIISGAKGGGSYATISGGSNNTIGGDGSFIGGGKNNATSFATYAAVVGGAFNTASAYYSTVSGGYVNTASGYYSVVGGGRNVNAQAWGEFATGTYSDDAASPSAFTFVATDRIFTVGNGTADAARSNAMIILKNGNTDINGNLVANSLGVDGEFTLPTADGTAGQVLQTDGSGAVSWQTASGGGGEFTNTANVIFAGDADDDFLFGSAQLADAGNAAEDNRMFFDKSSGAFRAGYASGIQWDNPGNFSFAAGRNNTASGGASTVGGGMGSTASGFYSSIGGGYGNTVAGNYSSVAGGRSNSVSGQYATIGGGKNNDATKLASTVSGGIENNAYGDASSVGGGALNTASGNYSTVVGGRSLKAQSLGEFATGLFSANAASPDAAGFVATDRIFTVGNGTADAARSNAMVILKNGNTDINGNLVANSLGVDGEFTLPTADGTAGQVLQTDGSGAVSWQTASGGASYVGAGTNSFVAGAATNIASGNHSTVGGGLYTKSIGGYSSVGGGYGNQTLEHASTVGGGQGNVANAYWATISGGKNNRAEGKYSTVAGGYNLNARSFAEFVTGVSPTLSISPNATSFVATDRIFTIGNGTSSVARSSALIILKNGNATLAGTLTQNSDRRLKRDIAPLGSTLDKVNEMEGVTYKWNNLTPRDTTEANIGLIAQEVEALFPELVKTGDNGYKSVNYIQLVPVLIEAIKELSQENNALETANAKMEVRQQGDDEKFAKLEAKLDYLMKIIAVEASVSTATKD